MKARLVLMGVAAAIVITGAWFFFMWKPASNDLDKAKADEQAAVDRASQLQTRLTHLRTLEKNAAVLERDKALLATAIPSADQLDQFILQTNERAARAGVSFVSVSPQEPSGDASGTGPSNIALQIQVSGNYFQIMRFLEELRDGPRLVTVDSFSVSGGAPSMSASIGGRMFLNPAAATPAPTPTA